MTVRDSKNFTAVCDDAEEPSEVEKAAARLTVCGNALDAEDAVDLLQMLGLYPGNDSASLLTSPLRNSFS
jgi:hypothetical protein